MNYQKSAVLVVICVLMVAMISWILAVTFINMKTEEMPVTRPKLQATSTNQTTYSHYTLATFNNDFVNESVELPHSDFNRCSFEYKKDGRIDCDWLQLASSAKTAPFKIVQSFDRIFSNGTLDFSTGVEIHSKFERRFVVARFPEKPAYLMSPVFKRHGGDSVKVSFFHAMTSCNQKIEAFLLSSKHIFSNVESVPNRFLVVTGNQLAWKQSQATVPVNSSFDEFKIMVKITHNEEAKNCEENNNEVDLVALDEINVEVQYPICAENKTTYKYINSPSIWKFKNWIKVKGFKDIILRGSDSEGAYFHSKTLKATSRCSCFFSFMFKLFNPRRNSNVDMTLTLVQKFSVSNEDKMDEQKFKVKLIANKWKHFKEKIILSEIRSPTRFEFVANEIVATGQQIHIKKIRFNNCGDLNV